MTKSSEDMPELSVLALFPISRSRNDSYDMGKGMLYLNSVVMDEPRSDDDKIGHTMTIYRYLS